MATRPPQIKVAKASGSIQGGGPAGLYQGGLGRTQELVNEREKQQREEKQTLRLNPKFPYRVVQFDPSFFNIPAAPVLLSDSDNEDGKQ